MKSTFVLALVVAMAALGMQSAWATPVPITVLNHSFEDAAGLGLVWDPFPTEGGSGQGYSQEAGVPDDGTCRGLLRTSEIGFTETVWTQVLSTNLAAETTYELTVAVGGSSGVPRDGGAYDIALYAGDMELVSGSATGYTISPDTEVIYKDATITYTSGSSVSGDPLKIVLSSIPDLDDQYWTVYDNVRLTANSAPVTVENYSFEDAATGVLGSMNLIPAPLANWEMSSELPPDVSWLQNEGGNGASQEVPEVDDGACRGLLRTSEMGGGVETVWTQELDATFEAGNAYALTVAVGGSGPVDGVHDGGAYNIALYAGDTELVSESATNYVNTDPLSYLDVTITYDPSTSGATPTAGDPLRIVLSSNPDIAGQYWTVYDNVRLTADTDPPVYVPGDADRDGDVDDDDAATLASNWLGAGGWAQGDFNHDGLVNDVDATLLATNWQTGTSASVPEPAVTVLLIGGLACFLLRRRALR